MSDKIDLNQRHLCTSEDAFEKFQAVSMYEEDEYISLSDIVPPQPAAPDFSGEVNDIPYENEVVLESNLEEQVPEVNSTIEISTDENASAERPSEEQQQNLPQEVSAPDENSPEKRGRKKKCQPSNQLTNTDSDQNKLADIASQDNEAIALTPTTPRKRGRPAKNVSQTQQNNVTADLPVSKFKKSSNAPIRTYSRKVVQTTTNNDTTKGNSAPKKTPGRHDRWKKSIPHQPVNKDSSIPELEEKNVSLNDEEDITPPARMKKKRGRKPRKTISDEPKSSIKTHEEMDKPVLPVDNSLSDGPLNPSIKKGKRGRPKRVLTKEKSDPGTVKLEKIVGENLKNKDCDVDDICLSQLKNSIEEVKDTRTMKSNGEVNRNKDVKVCEKVSAEDSKDEECVSIKETEKKETGEVVQLQEKEVSRKRNLKQPVMQDFEYNIDSIVSETRQEIVETENNNPENEELKDSLLVEDPTRRPVRKKARQSMHYDEGSDEDPFANVELSDEDDMRGRKGRYYSDDEYIPGLVKKRGSKHEFPADTDTSDSDIDNIDEKIQSMNSKHKRFRKSDGLSYKKRGRKSKEELTLLAKGKTGRFSPEVSTIKPNEKILADNDVEICLETSVIKAPNETKPSWGTSNEFENFLAKKIQGTDIKIKKSSAPVQPLEIPVIDPNEAKKTIEIFTQTTEIKTKSTGIQTTAAFDAPMKSNVSLTAEQSEKACEFLNSIVKTTAELGELMTQKSEDFIKKKINTNHVTDTFKMDYCVRKSFLLFKLAKHNLMQMEEDLAKQYDDFLNTHNLSQYRDTPKVLKAEPKAKDSDSDCEIIETPALKTPTKKEMSSLIPKTVFLNKELSIKIAKKPSDDKKINIKGRHTVWINDSVMVKKVKPTQSFLAQDSRNKKPPDCVTIEMVNAFFKAYNHKRASETCAPFVSPEWLAQQSVYVCNYFFASTEEFPTSTGMPSGSGHCQNVEDEELSASNMNDNSLKPPEGNQGTSNPKTLLSLCTLVLQNYLHHTKSNILDVSAVEDKVILDKKNNPESLFRLSLKSINKTCLHNEKEEEISAVKDCINNAPSLKTMCHKKMVEILSIHRTAMDYSPCSPIHHDNQIIDFKPESDQLSTTIKPTSLMPLYDGKLFLNDLVNKYINSVKPWTNFRSNGLKSLFSLCFDLINIKLNCQETHNFYNNLKPPHEFTDLKNSPKSLKLLAYNLVDNLIFGDENNPIKFADKYSDSVTKKKVKTLADLCFEKVTKAFIDNDNQTPKDGLTINAVNTLTEEAFHNIDQSELSENGDDYYPDDDSNVYDEATENCDNNLEKSSHVEDNWLSQVQMEVNSCFEPNISIPKNISQEQAKNSLNIVTRIKIEPVEEVSETVDISIVKSEPIGNLDEMTIIPESIVTKSEFSDLTSTSREPIQRQNSSSFDVDQFEAFASTNKMMYSLNNYENDDEIFSQSASRIRRQYEPDSDTENDMTQDCMGLLVPQTYEPMPIIEKDKAKNSLMESSEDENNSSNNKKHVKKKPEKRSRGRTKKNDPKPAVHKETTRDKPIGTNEIAMLTRKMREKIRQEEKKVVSSDSEHENDKVISKKGKEKHKTKTKTAYSEETDDKQNKTSSDKMEPTETKPADDEIQCSNVDSTEQVNEIFGSVSRNMSPSLTNFSGFSALDQNEITSYHKYVKYVYDQIIPKVTGEENQCQTNTNQPLINPDEPVELLECEPIMPFLMEEHSKPSRTTPTKRGKAAKKQDLENTATTTVIDENSPPLKATETKKGKSFKKEMKENIQLPKTDEKSDLSEINTSKEENPLYIERHGWKCYPLNGDDNKLHHNAQILLEKLPESFVETYFKYQNLTHKDKEDEEVDRLINLQTLNRTSAKDSALEVKTNQCKGRPKCKIQPQVKNAVFSILGLNAEDDFSGINSPDPASPANSEQFHELAPSDDEGGKIDEKIPVAVEKPPSDNNLAKSSLMDDKDSDDETKIKEEPKDPEAADAETKPFKKNKPGPKSKKLKEKVPVMLTADKMMNKELNLLHAPVNINDDDTKIQTPVKSGPVTRNSKQKGASKMTPKERIKNEEDSSSEEEKQWFTIKEKLLKRMVKKHDTTREDDAKRAKLVSEFIERRGDGTESYLKKRRGPRGPRSKKKLLERQKQLRVLTRELFGDPSNDTSLQRKKQTAAYFKGRRNIRKVLDKKSLAKGTVVANMEEFERKRRLTIRQSKLREVLRCEEGVNVLVINDELCLEYDFDQNRPVVTVHPFFTKVMKAHQYEGVKFMWDACFESLESLAAGSPGGGCILAHCMGLGKTLQVLALLHTVLTHPSVGMQRVLVCCPLSTVLNWVDEIHKWIGPVTNQIKVFELSKLRKTYERAYQLEDWYNGGGIFIIGYELFRSLTTLDPYLDDVRPTIINKIRTALLEPGPDIIICDEGHLLKNDCSVLAVAMSRVATRRRIVLTGTPMQNNLREYYCMVNFVKPNLLGTYAEYSNRFENPIMNGQHRDSREEDIKLMKARTHILHKVLEGCLQRQEASVLYPYLPKKHEYTVFISLTKCQWDLYKHYLLNYGNTQNNKSILKDFHILQKIWSHPQVLHNFQMRVCDEAKVKAKLKVEKLEDDLASEDLKEKEVDVKPSDTEVWWLQYLEGGAMLDSLASSNKFAAVFRILDESVTLGDKVLIFSTSLFTMDALEFFLKKINNWSLGQEYYRLDGSVPPEVRQKWCREFNAENNVKTKLFLISTRAGSLGLNMTAANRVIILDTSWNPAHDIQSIFRVYRFGQKKDCYIYRLVALGTMEQKIYERSVTKQAVACRVVDEQQIDRHYNMAELTELYKYDETGVGVAGGVAVGVEDVVLLRVARDAALHAVHEHDSLLRGSGEQGLPESERNAAWMQFQQEHANKQMQEDALQQALLAQKLKQEELAEKRPTRKYAKLKMPIKPEETEESILPEPAGTLPAGQRQRGRRVKKNNVVTCRIPIQPEAAEAPSLERESTVVRKIAEILLEYNFQDRRSQQELSVLVERVHHIVASGQTHTLDTTDPLTMRIANVFLGRDENPMPALTDVAPGPFEIKDEAEKDVETPPPKTRGRKKGSKRKTFVVEEIPSTSAVLTPPVQVKGSRTRRRAALEAGRNFDEEVVACDRNWQNDDSDSPISEIKLAKDAQAAPRPVIQYPASEKRQRKLNKQEAKVKVEESCSVDVEAAKNAVILDSILLSDDDEPPPQRKPGPARRTGRRPRTVERTDEPVEPVSKPLTDEPIPLHPTLLSNKNFIKIVAHTYLTGNPMLDEDAATLAAQYSTFKALKEYESTKKDIVSGPLHDIAVKVLGISVLQVLHESKTQVVTKEIIDSHPINSKVESPSRDTPAAEPPPAAAAPHENKPVKIRIRIPPLPANLAATGDATQPSAGNVVPVGLYKRAEEGPSSTVDECILPDDDDIRIVSAPHAPPVPIPPAAPVTPAASSKPLPTIYIKRRNVTPLVVTRVKADPPRAPASEEILSDLPPTISLDSDDDEPGGASVVPVALSRVSQLAAPPSQLTRVAASAVPISVQNIVSSQIASSSSPPPPVSDPPRQAGKKVCMPGDILRNTKTGGFEVLRSHDVPPERSTPARPASAESPAPSRSVPAPHQPPIVVRPSPASKAPAVAPPTPACRSGGSVADDPLSILRNVVHIEADDYPADNNIVKKRDPPQGRAAGRPSTPKIPETPSTSRAAGKSGERASAEGKWHKVLSHNTKQESPVKPGAPKNLKPDQNRKPTQRTEIQVDLTDDDVPPKTGPSVSNKLIGLKGATTIIGTSKSIILCGYGKAIAKTNLGAVKRDTIVKQVEPSPAAKNKAEKKIYVKIKSEAKNKNEEKKRPAQPDSGAVKKKKTDKPMTLKDFNIDDIDDIIELE